MPQLVIDLLEGFEGGDVRIEVDQVLVAEVAGVVSNEMTGFATSIETDVAPGPHVIVVTGGRTPVRGEFSVDRETWVGVDAAADTVFVSHERQGNA